jgi:hypothetical protein
MGLYNRGKTHITNKLANKTFATGLATHTQGLSVMLPRKNEHFMILDTAGQNQPVENGKDQDREASEAFLQKAAIALSDVVVIVVNALTRTDQQYIKQLMKRLKSLEEKGPKNVIVVHNLRDVNEVSEAEKKIDKDIVRCFNATEEQLKVSQESGELFTYWKGEGTTSENGKTPTVIQHVVIAMEGSPAGNKYNNMTFNWLYKKFLALQSDVANEKQDNILERFLDLTAKFLPKVFSTPDGVDKTCVKMAVTGTEPFRIALCKPQSKGLVYRSGLQIADGMLDEASVGGLYRPAYNSQSNTSMTVVTVDLQGVGPGTTEPIDMVYDEQEVDWYDRDDPEGFNMTLLKNSKSDLLPSSLTIRGRRPAWLDRNPGEDLNMLHKGQPDGGCSLNIKFGSERKFTGGRLEWENGIMTVFLDHYVKQSLFSRIPPKKKAGDGVDDHNRATKEETSSEDKKSTTDNKKNAPKMDDHNRATKEETSSEDKKGTATDNKRKASIFSFLQNIRDWRQAMNQQNDRPGTPATSKKNMDFDL